MRLSTFDSMAPRIANGWVETILDFVPCPLSPSQKHHSSSFASFCAVSPKPFATTRIGSACPLGPMMPMSTGNCKTGVPH